MPYCTTCKTLINPKSWVGHLRSSDHKSRAVTYRLSDDVEILASAFRNRIATYKIKANDDAQRSLDSFFQSIHDKIKSLINQSLKTHFCIKVNVELFSFFLMYKNDSQELKSFGTKNVTLHMNYNFDSFFSEIKSTLKKKIEEFSEQDSGWTFLSNSHLEININKYQPLSGSSFIELPKFIKNKKACVNIKNDDPYCFLWCVTAALFPSKSHPDRVSSYPDFRNIFNIQGMSFPTNFSDIAVFEKNNPDIAIFVYGLQGKKTVIGPLYRSDSSTAKNIVHLLFLENDEGSHFCLIKNLPRLVRSQITKHHQQLHFCDSCLLFFNTSNEVENHLCGGIATVLPKQGSFLAFKNYERKQNMPFIIYADFETMLQRHQGCEADPNIASTSTLQQHVPSAFGYYIVCTMDEKYNRYVSYRGTDCVSKFVEWLYRDTKQIYAVLKKNVKIIFTEDNLKSFETAIRCHICDHLLLFDKVRDHCHITGLYRGAAHSHCNLQFKLPNFVPIVFHNLSGYDCHLFIKELGAAPGAIKIIPKTKENYISFTKYIPLSKNEGIQLRFIDSYKFLGTSLDKLTKTMKVEEFSLLKSFFPIENEFNLLTRKGVYPYDYMSQWERYEEKDLPQKSYFYNSISDQDISDQDYEHAKTVWETFSINDLGEYTDLYVKTDVLLLADIFENFRKTCKRYYQLDPAFYLTAPSLSFDAMLLKTKVRLELLSDLAIVRMIQDGIRGGVCMCSKRYAKANNKYMPDYEPSLPDSFIIYIDANNLYGFSMSALLPLSDFRFLEQSEVDTIDIASVPDNATFGFILEVDIIYPENLHDDHNDFPFCPDRCTAPGGKSAKLIPNLYDKYRYVIHYVHLKTCLKHGLKLRKIHRAITFRQSAYLKQYIELNTQLRQQAQSTFEQDFFKLLNNSIFGKTIENTERRVNVHLVNQWNDSQNKTKKFKSAEKLVARPNFHSASIFSENLVAIQMKPERVVLDKPIYIGFAVLELSKSHMYDFHYSIIKPMYGKRVELCYTDTDSFIYLLWTDNFFQDLKYRLLTHFDTSNYDINNKYLIPLRNKKIPGLFKDEMGGKIITEFVGLRSKLYCFRTLNKTIKKAKGVKMSVIRNLDFSNYEQTLFEGKVLRKKNILFKSIKHEIFTQSVNKVALSRNDDKRLINRNQISTIAWGHTSILGK
ncbi:hypothetical protein JYU34_016555 [Plutella xylostella]|uniref:DNA-directed DNA polymerase n=1 Tax=Plutella xylostella TaxID=51655 RepID=A0ABQ7Q365_PLUXY|nr:hypothetical protein JYU34_016555 [Plutella xylostella]